MSESTEKGRLIKDALKIVDELADIEIDEIKDADAEYDNLDTLVDKAKKLKRNRWWKLT